MKTPPTENEVVDTVARAAEAALIRTKGNAQDASRELASMVRKDANLRAALLDPLIEYACSIAVNKSIQKNRDRVWSPSPIPTNASDQDRVRALAAGNLMLFPLPGGKLLGESTREDIAKAIDFYEKQAADMSHKARWLRLVNQSVPDGKPVMRALNEARLRELQDEARTYA